MGGWCVYGGGEGRGDSMKNGGKTDQITVLKVTFSKMKEMGEASLPFHTDRLRRAAVGNIATLFFLFFFVCVTFL